VKDRGSYQLLKLERCPEALAFVKELQKNIKNDLKDIDVSDAKAKARYFAKSQFINSYCKVTEKTKDHYFILIRLEHTLGKFLGLIGFLMKAASEKLLKKVGYEGQMESSKDRKYLKEYIQKHVTAKNS